MDTDVVVVGAGPAGGLAARQLARKGLSVILLEEHSKVGQPVHCAGLIGIKGLQNNGITPQPQVILQQVQRSIFHAPAGTQLLLDKGKPHAFVLHRNRLDQQLAQEAERAGAELLLESRVVRISREPKGMRLKSAGKGASHELRAQCVVNAEGIRAQFVRNFDLPLPKKEFMLPALQYEVTNISLPTDTVHLYFDSRLAKNFFAWVIPLDDHHARVGLATAHRQARLALDKFLKTCTLVKGAKIEKRYGGIVYTGGPSSRTVTKRFVSVGDAAGQTKATTGGGVVAGGACAGMVAASINRALKDGQYNHGALELYEQQWKRTWGRQLRLMAILRRLVNTLANRELDQLFKNLQQSKVKQIIESRGDIDRQGQLIITAFTSPVILRSVSRLLLSKIRYLPQLLWG